MAIDDPLDAAEERLAAEERMRSPLARFIPDLAALVALVPTKFVHAELLKNGLKGAGLFLSKIQAERREYFIKTLAEEFRRTRSQVEAQQRFLDEEWLPLVIDGLQKAEQTLSRDRIRRIAGILAYAIEVAPGASAATVEELMRIAMLLSDDDVVVLRALHTGQISKYNPHNGRVTHEEANDFWRLLDPGHRSYGEPEHKTLQQFSIGRLQGICAKLHSLGLIAQVERNNMKLSPGIIPYAILANAVDFVQFTQSVE